MRFRRCSLAQADVDKFVCLFKLRVGFNRPLSVAKTTLLAAERAHAKENHSVVRKTLAILEDRQRNFVGAEEYFEVVKQRASLLHLLFIESKLYYERLHREAGSVALE